MSESHSFEPPDGGYGWIIAISCFIIIVAGTMPLGVYSVMYSKILMHKDTSATTASLIFNISFFMRNIVTIFTSALSTFFSFRSLSMMGTALSSLGIILSAFATNSTQLFLCFTFLFGLGYGIFFPVQQFIITKYFKKKRGLILGLTLTFSAGSFIVSPILIGFLNEYYSYQGATLIIGGIMLNCIAASAMFHPVEWHLKSSAKVKPAQNPEISGDFAFNKESSTVTSISKESNTANELPCQSTQVNIMQGKDCSRASSQAWGVKDIAKQIPGGIENKPTSSSLMNKYDFMLTFLKTLLQNLMVVKSHRAKIIALAYILHIPIFLNTLMVIPFLLKEKNQSLELSLQILSIIAFSSLASRLLVSLVVDRLPFSSKYYFMFGAFLASVSSFGYTLVIDSTYFIALGVFYGFGQGCCLVVRTLTSIEFMGLEYLMPSYSLVNVGIALTSLFIGPLFGAIHNIAGSYNVTMRVLSGAYLLSVLLWFLMPLAKSSDEKRGCAQPTKDSTH